MIEFRTSLHDKKSQTMSSSFSFVLFYSICTISLPFVFEVIIRINFICIVIYLFLSKDTTHVNTEKENRGHDQKEYIKTEKQRDKYSS